MAGFKQQTKADGWTEKVSESSGDPTLLTLRQRLAENNKLWVICLVVVALLVVAVMAKIILDAAKQKGANHQHHIASVGIGTFDDSDHTAFARKVTSDQRYSSSVVEAKFIGPGLFRIVVSGSASNDEIEAASLMAAYEIKHRFGEDAVVHAYMESSNNHKRTLVADTTWDEEKSGFSVQFKK